MEHYFPPANQQTHDQSFAVHVLCQSEQKHLPAVYVGEFTVQSFVPAYYEQSLNFWRIHSQVSLPGTTHC